MKLRMIFVVLLFAAAAGIARADGLIIPIRPDLRVRSSWAVKYHKVNIKVRDQVADVSIDQAFVNTGAGAIEVQYLFPIPPAAAIDSLTLLVDGKEFRGRILRAEEARRAYEEVVRTKRDPALLEYVNYGLFRTSAFPLLPGKAVRVVVHYTDVCKKDGDTVEVFYPLNTEKFSALAIDEVEIRTDILAKSPISVVYSPTHQVDIDRPTPEHVIASYKIEKQIPSDDYRLLYQESRDSVGATVLSYRPKDQEDGFFLLMASPTLRAGKAPVVPKDLVIALDRSGSMSGEKIRQAKASLEFVLRNLNAADRFNVLAYNESIDPLFEGLAANESGNINKALSMIDRIDASGSTNIHDALTAAIKAIGSAGSEKRSRYILFLTDGLPTVGLTSESIILSHTAAANETAKARIFAMGIGYDVNVRLLDRLVSENRGAGSYVKEKEPLEAKISSLYSKLKNPIMTDLSVTLSGVKTTMTYPQIIPDLFDGSQLIMVGRYNRPGPTDLVISGNYGGNSRSFRYPADLARTSDKFSYAFVEQIWAMRRIGFLLDQIQLNGRSGEVVDELVRLSRLYGIITPYTSFLADERSDLSSMTYLKQKGEAAARDLSSNNIGGIGQLNASNRLTLNNAVTVNNSSFAGVGSAQIGQSNLANYESNQTERLVNVQNLSLNNRALYKRGRQWIDSTISDRDISKLNAEARPVAQFSEEYFRLAAANSIVDNQILAMQQPDEEMIVSIRGQVYRITPAK
jgi:Ca-activated chloride channel homolog